MRPTHPLPALLALLLGCSPAEDPGDPPPIPKGGDTGDTAVDCSGVAPVITSLQARADGLHEDEQGQTFPAMVFELQADDADGDLSFVSYRMWWDDQLDGVVDTSVAAPVQGQAAISTTRCASFSVGLNLSLSSQGNPAYDTWHDFAVALADEAGIWSEPALCQGAMPKEDGSDPDPLE
jgi:hypothetical protein